jgi:hypothetical protein
MGHERCVKYRLGMYSPHPETQGGYIDTEQLHRAGLTRGAIEHGALADRSACSGYGGYRRWDEPFELITAENRRPSGHSVHQSRTLLRRDIWPSQPSRSDFERKVPAFIHRFGLPDDELNARVGEFEVDVLFGADRLIVELDTFATHLLNFHSERAHDAEILARCAIPTIRLT